MGLGSCSVFETFGMEFLRASPEAGLSSSPNTFLCTLFWRCSINWTWFSQRYALQCCYRLSHVMNHCRVLFCFNLISQAGWVFLTVLLNVGLITGSHHSLWLPTCKPWLTVKVKQTTCWYNFYCPFKKKELCTLRSTSPKNVKIKARSIDVFSLQEVLIIWARAQMSPLTSSSHGTCAQLQQFQVTPGWDMTLWHIVDAVCFDLSPVFHVCEPGFASVPSQNPEQMETFFPHCHAFTRCHNASFLSSQSVQPMTVLVASGHPKWDHMSTWYSNSLQCVLAEILAMAKKSILHPGFS